MRLDDAGRSDCAVPWLLPQEMDFRISPYLRPGSNVIALRVLCLEEYFGQNGLYEQPFIYTNK